MSEGDIEACFEASPRSDDTICRTPGAISMAKRLIMLGSSVPRMKVLMPAVSVSSQSSPIHCSTGPLRNPVLREQISPEML